jgi:hypothetical protein
VDADEDAEDFSELVNQGLFVKPVVVDPAFMITPERATQEKNAKTDPAVVIHCSTQFERDWDRAHLEKVLLKCFPFGVGIRSSKESLADVCAHYARTGRPQFMCQEFHMSVYNIVSRMKASSKAMTRGHTKWQGERAGDAFSRINSEELKIYSDYADARKAARMAHKPEPPSPLPPETTKLNEMFCKTLHACCASMEHTPDNCKNARKKFDAMQYCNGKATLFITFTPEDTMNICVYVLGKGVPTEIKIRPSAHVANLLSAMYPGASAMMFDRFLNCFIEVVLGWDRVQERSYASGGLFGFTKDWGLVVDNQARDCLHAHLAVTLHGHDQLLQRLQKPGELARFTKVLDEMLLATLPWPKQAHADRANQCADCKKPLECIPDFEKVSRDISGKAQIPKDPAILQCPDVNCGRLVPPRQRVTELLTELWKEYDLPGDPTEVETLRDLRWHQLSPPDMPQGEDADKDYERRQLALCAVLNSRTQTHHHVRFSCGKSREAKRTGRCRAKLAVRIVKETVVEGTRRGECKHLGEDCLGCGHPVAGNSRCVECNDCFSLCIKCRRVMPTEGECDCKNVTCVRCKQPHPKENLACFCTLLAPVYDEESWCTSCHRLRPLSAISMSIHRDPCSVWLAQTILTVSAATLSNANAQYINTGATGSYITIYMSPADNPKEQTSSIAALVSLTSELNRQEALLRLHAEQGLPPAEDEPGEAFRTGLRNINKGWRSQSFAYEVSAKTCAYLNLGRTKFQFSRGFLYANVSQILRIMLMGPLSTKLGSGGAMSIPSEFDYVHRSARAEGMCLYEYFETYIRRFRSKTERTHDEVEEVLEDESDSGLSDIEEEDELEASLVAEDVAVMATPLIIHIGDQPPSVAQMEVDSGSHSEASDEQEKKDRLECRYNEEHPGFKMAMETELPRRIFVVPLGVRLPNREKLDEDLEGGPQEEHQKYQRYVYAHHALLMCMPYRKLTDMVPAWSALIESGPELDENGSYVNQRDLWWPAFLRAEELNLFTPRGLEYLRHQQDFYDVTNEILVDHTFTEKSPFFGEEEMPGEKDCNDDDEDEEGDGVDDPDGIIWSDGVHPDLNDVMVASGVYGSPVISE